MTSAPCSTRRASMKRSRTIASRPSLRPSGARGRDLAVPRRTEALASARRFFEEVLAHDSQHIEARIRLGRVLWGLGENVLLRGRTRVDRSADRNPSRASLSRTLVPRRVTLVAGRGCPRGRGIRIGAGLVSQGAVSRGRIAARQTATDGGTTSRAVSVSWRCRQAIAWIPGSTTTSARDGRLLL